MTQLGSNNYLEVTFMPSDLESIDVQEAPECSSQAWCDFWRMSFKSEILFFVSRVASKRSCRRMQRWGGLRWQFLWSSVSFHTCRCAGSAACVCVCVCRWDPCWEQLCTEDMTQGFGGIAAKILLKYISSPYVLLSMLGVVVPSEWPWSNSTWHWLC